MTQPLHITDEAREAAQAERDESLTRAEWRDRDSLPLGHYVQTLLNHAAAKAAEREAELRKLVASCRQTLVHLFDRHGANSANCRIKEIDETFMRLTPPGAGTDGVEVPVIDLEANSWLQIKDAARQSPWMPPEYMMSDWVSDVCQFLTEPPTAPAPVIQPESEVKPCATQSQLRKFHTETVASDGAADPTPVSADAPAPVGGEVYDRSIHTNPDAMAWAQFFTKTWREVHPDKEPPDEGWMLSWFANAMMAMHDHLKSQEQRKSTPAAPTGEAGTPNDSTVFGDFTISLTPLESVKVRIKGLSGDLMMTLAEPYHGLVISMFKRLHAVTAERDEMRALAELKEAGKEANRTEANNLRVKLAQCQKQLQDADENTGRVAAELAATNQTIERLRADERREKSTRRFPMQNGPSIPWSLAELLYVGYSAQYGTDQSLERLAQRGGFGWAEIQLWWTDRNVRRFRSAIEAALTQPTSTEPTNAEALPQVGEKTL